jgi:predicted metalloprotease with PDZ domain
MLPSLRSLSLLAVLCLSVFTGRSVWAQQKTDIAFTVTVPRPWTHLLEVEMRVTGVPSGESVDLVMPVWTPGSYVLREYARNVQDFAAVGADGKPLPWHKASKNIWRVERGGATAFIVRYRVYANVLRVQEAEVTDTHAFWNNAAVLLHVAGRLDAPATLTIQPPVGWKVATGLTATGPNAFRAPDFDTLYDCPVEISAFAEIAFTVRGVPHRLVIDGAGNYDSERVRRDVQKVVETEAKMMGEIPYENYTFILHLRSGAGGGLEHKNSTALGFSPYGFRKDESYQGFLTLIAHEFFHLWNVKRIKPDALGPFDYGRENYTRLLWVAEGITSYYGGLHVRRAGLMSADDYLKSLARSMASLDQTPGRKEMSLEEASFDAWIKYYRPDENAANSQVSYYEKGALVGLLLDLTIRQRTGGTKSLDDVMRTLYTDYARKNENYTPEDFQRVCEATAGGSLDGFFSRFVRGRDELDYDTTLSAVGLRLERAAPDKDGKPAAPEAFLGARLVADPAGVRVTAVPSDTPAYDQGLSAGDLLVALDGVRVTTPDAITDRLQERKPGDTVPLTLFRGDSLRTLDVKLGGRIRPSYRLIPLNDASEVQKKAFKAWLAADFPKG